MTYSLPFGLKQKPLRHYFENGSISFSCKEGKLYATLTITTRSKNKKIDSNGSSLIMLGFNKWKYDTIEVKTKELLNKLLSAKTLNEIPTIEVVN